nr:MAG TPA: hypothetical protein [Caudoviricetes sp.]
MTSLLCILPINRPVHGSGTLPPPCYVLID